MTEENAPRGGETKGGGGDVVAGKLTAVGWGLFFIWIAVVLLQDYGTEIGLLGVGIITLVMQIGRKIAGLAMEGFWVVVGVIFVGGGLWAIYEVNFPLIPVALLVAGLLILLSVLRRKP